MVVGVEQGEEVSEHPSVQAVSGLTGIQEAKQLQWIHGALRLESEELCLVSSSVDWQSSCFHTTDSWNTSFSSTTQLNFKKLMLKNKHTTRVSILYK